MWESSFPFSPTNTSQSFTKPRHQSDSECAFQPRANFHCISFDEGLKLLIFYSELKTIQRKVLVLETLNNSLRMSAAKAVSKQRQGGWSSCLGRTLRSQLLLPLARECANHHPNCRKPGPDSGGKSAFPCQLEKGLLFLCVQIMSTVPYVLFSL